jgi:hypothetical protein
LLKGITSGSGRELWKAIDCKTGQLVMLERIAGEGLGAAGARRTYREMVLLHELNHPNIVKLRRAFRAPIGGDLYLAFEFLEESLHGAIRQKALKDT